MKLRRILTLIAVTAVVAVVGLAVYGWANGVRFYAVESGSMSPAMNQGDLVVDLPTTATTTYEVGDVITFHLIPTATTTHRIVAIDTSGLTTKGDANATADLGPIPPSSVVGRVLVVVPFAGAVADFFRRPAGVAALIASMIAAVLAWQLGAWFMHDRRQKDGATVDGAARPEALSDDKGHGAGADPPALAGMLGGASSSEQHQEGL